MGTRVWRRLGVVALVFGTGVAVPAGAAGGLVRRPPSSGACAVLTPTVARTLLGDDGKRVDLPGSVAGLAECSYEGAGAGADATLREETPAFFRAFAFTTPRGAVLGSVGEPGVPGSGITREAGIGAFAVVGVANGPRRHAQPAFLGWVEGDRAYIVTVDSRVVTRAVLVRDGRETASAAAAS